MPCSRSADRPSVSSARSVSPLRCTPASWSCSTVLLSTSRRPISVLLPSSTDAAGDEPQRGIMVFLACSPRVLFVSCYQSSSAHQKYPSFLRFSIEASEVLSSMRVAPRSLTSAASVSITTSAASAGQAVHRAGAGDVAHGAKAHVARHDLLAVARRRERRHRHQQAAALDHFALVRVVERRQGDVLALDVLPDVELGPVARSGTRGSARRAAGAC